jgi:outer membrane lipoprotein-sorting protein
MSEPRGGAGPWSLRAAAALLGVLAAASGVAQQPPPAEVQSWLQAVDEARNAFSEVLIRARATQREDGKVTGSVDFDIYAKGRERALIVFRGGKNEGRKVLTVGDRMWLIVPGAENPVPITPNQRLMGGASFGDVARIRFADDFTAKLRPGTEEVLGDACYVLDLTAVSKKAAYPSVVLWLDAAKKLPRKVLFRLPSGRDAREVLFTGFREVRGKMAVSEMEIRDLLGPNQNSVTTLDYLKFEPAKIDDGVFTPEGARAL